MVEENHGLAVNIANRAFKSGIGRITPQNLSNVTLDELISAAATGLIYAVKSFDKSLGYAFSTYGYKTIYGRILSYVFRKNKMIKTGKKASVISSNKVVYNNGNDESIDLESMLEDPSSRESMDLVEYMTVLKSSLSEREYNVFMGRVFEGKKWGEISSQTGYAVNTLRSDYRRSVLKLREEFQDIV